MIASYSSLHHITACLLCVVQYDCVVYTERLTIPLRFKLPRVSCSMCELSTLIAARHVACTHFGGKEEKSQCSTRHVSWLRCFREMHELRVKRILSILHESLQERKKRSRTDRVLWTAQRRVVVRS